MVGSNLSNACNLYSQGARTLRLLPRAAGSRARRVRRARLPGAGPDAARGRPEHQHGLRHDRGRAATLSSSVRTSRRSPSPRGTRCTCSRAPTTTARSTCRGLRHRAGLARGRRLARRLQVLRRRPLLAELPAARLPAGQLAGGPRLAAQGLQRRGRPDGAGRRGRSLLLQRHRLQPRHEQRRGLRARPSSTPTRRRTAACRPAPTPCRTWRTVVVDTGTSGQFLDKTWIAVDIPRAGRRNLHVQRPGTARRRCPPATSIWRGAALPEARARRSW